MNTKEKAIAAALFAVLAVVIFWPRPDTPPQETAGSDSAGIELSNGTTDTSAVDAIAGGVKHADTSKPDAVKPDASKDSETVNPPITLLKRFSELSPAKPHELDIPREDGSLETTPLARVIIDPEKGGITEVRLDDYLHQLKQTANMRLGADDNPMLALDNETRTLKFSHALIIEHSPTKLVIERQILGTDVIVRQRWRVTPNSFRITYTMTVLNKGTVLANLKGLRMNAGIMGPLVPPKGMFGASGIDQRMQYKEVSAGDSDYEQITNVLKFDDEDKKEYADMKLRWVSIQNKFFTTSLLCEKEMSGCSFEAPELIQDNEEVADKSTKLNSLIGFIGLPEVDGLAPGASFDRDYEFYVGPKIYDRLKALKADSQQEQIMGFDIFILWHFAFMKYIALGIYNLLTFLFNMVGNFGMAIVISTVIIRLLFSPITYKSSIWSQRMKEIQPEMAAIKEKYAADPQKMNMMVMQLYKEKKVNPVGGCLPIFFQIPVFFALFNVLRSAIELRHAEFLFIIDLSQPDMLFMLPSWLPFINGMPFNILPFLMGGAMYLQQKLMPTSADPMQQKMMGFMTIFVTFICYNMPAGLTLYWTISNICSIIQFKITHKLIEKQTKAKAS